MGCELHECLTAVGTRIAVGGGRTAVGGLPAPGAADPLRLGGLPMLDGGRWLVIMRLKQTDV